MIPMSSRIVTGVHTPVDAPRLRAISSEEKRALGCTRWKSPPPDVGWKVYAVTLFCGDLGLLLIAFGMGWI